jgi:L-threonylcarbamoyladenylate synthase
MLAKKSAIKILKAGGIGVLPTDTIYGLVGQALNKDAVERIYRVRRRRPDKPLIILISSYDDLKLFGVKLDQKDKKILDRFWPGQVSVILPCSSVKFKYLHRGLKSLAFRLPDKKQLRDLIRQTGPLVAPSANPEGEKTAKNLMEAKNYFGDNTDFYYGYGDLISPPSTLVELSNGRLNILRQGKVHPVK